MNVEGPGNGTDRLPVADEFPGQLLLVGAHFLRPAEGDAARLGFRVAVAQQGFAAGVDLRGRGERNGRGD